MSFDTIYLLRLCKDILGSRVVESFLQSNCPNDRKQKFIDKLAKNFVSLSYDRYGAHCVEACFQHAEVSRKVNVLLSSPFNLYRI